MTSTYRIKDLPLLSIEKAQGRAKASLVKAKQQLGFVWALMVRGTHYREPVPQAA
jgi:hypothetical protein